MAVNPMAIMKLRERLEIFHSEHPKIEPFVQMLRDRTLMEGTVYELKATTPDGTELVANIRLTANDLETIRILSENR